MKNIIKNITFLSLTLVVLVSSNNTIAQDVEIVLGKNSIALNEYFTITLKVKNGKFKSYSPFPDIKNFVKRGVSNQSSTTIVNGRMSQEINLVQNYQARKQGSFKLGAFKMKVNDKVVFNRGTTIKVGAKKQRQQRQSYDPFADFFGRSNSAQQPKKYVNVKEDAFFSISTNKKEVYSGEGFTMTIAFYIARANRAQMDFHDLSNQVGEIIRKAKPKNCWEENFEITEIRPEEVEINGKQYTQYKLYQAAFYPLNSENIVIPPVGIKMIKYKVAKRQSFFGRNRQKDFKTFYSAKKRIKVKELPEHPLKEQVAVGNYRLMEGVNEKKYETGQSFNYQFKIVGEGNISAIKEPILTKNDKLQFYPPNQAQDINRANGRVAGRKTFDYYIIPDEPGEYNMGDYISWVYFSPKKERYDTLKTKAHFTVTGGSKKNTAILSSDLGDFYNRIPFEDTTLRNINSNFDIYLWIKIALVLMTIGIGYVYIKRK